MLGVARPCNDSVILSVAKDLGREWEQGTFASGVQMLHFVQHDNRAGVPDNLGTPRRWSGAFFAFTWPLDADIWGNGSQRGGC